MNMTEVIVTELLSDRPPPAPADQLAGMFLLLALLAAVAAIEWQFGRGVSRLARAIYRKLYDEYWKANRPK